MAIRKYQSGESCPVCGFTNQSCGQSTNSDLLFCRKINFKEGTPDGFSWRGNAKKDEQFGLFVEGTDEVQTDEDREKWEEKQRLRLERSAIEEKKRLARLPRVEQRDREYREKIRRNPLKDEHRQDLIRRGYTPEQIAQSGCYSDWRGLAFTIQDIDGRLVGAQIKTRNGYVWDKVGINQLSGCGELPLSIRGDRDNPKRILIVEGTGAKVQIAALMYPDCIVVGASGGHHAASSRQLNQICDKFPDISIVLLPDAGSISNKTVFKSYESTYKFLSSIDRELKVAWWGQVDKSKGDIDEIVARTKIDLISWDKFAGMTNTIRWHERSLFAFEKLSSKTKSQLDESEPATQVSAIEYTDTDGMTTILGQIVADGGRFVWDKSGTGSGKSTIAGMLREVSDIKGIMLVTNNYRHPSTKEVEQSYVILPGKCDWLYVVPDRLTPLGNPYLLTSQPNGEDYPRISGNCHRAKMHALWSNSGWAENDEKNPICATCPFNDRCHYEKGDGYGVKFERGKALANRRLICAPGSMPHPSNFDYSDWLIIFDDEKPEFYRSLIANKAHVEKTLTRVYLADPQLGLELSSLFNSILAKIGVTKHFGFEHEEIVRDICLENIDDLIRRVNDIVTPSRESIKFSDKKSAVIARLESKGLTFKDNRQELVDIEPNWLVQTLEVLSGQVVGSLRMSKEELTVKQVSNYHRSIFKKAALTLFLDASENIDDLAKTLETDPNEITVISQPSNRFDNVHFTQVTGIKNTSKDRSQYSDDRIEKLALNRVQHHGSASVIDKKKTSVADYRWWRDSRGTNMLIAEKCLIIVGAPVQNLGSLADEYSILTGSIVSATSKDSNFLAFVRRRVIAEINQAIGRLRAQHRPDEQLFIYFVYDRNDLLMSEILAAYPDMTLATTPVADICLEAADYVTQRLVYIRKRMTENPLIKQTQLAIETGVSVATISNDFNKIGGFRETSANLVRGLYSSAEVLNSRLADWSNWLEVEVVEFMVSVLERPIYDYHESSDLAIEAKASEVANIVAVLTDTQLLGLFGQLSEYHQKEVIGYLQVHMIASIPTQPQIDAANLELAPAS